MKIQIKNKTKNIFFIYIDDEIRGTLPVGVLRFFSLFPGQEGTLSADQKNDLLYEIEKFSWNNLLNFLAYRERSVWECHNFLNQQFLPSQIAEKLVRKAEELNLINDVRFVEIYVDDLIRQNRNKNQIRQKLKEKHLSDELIEDALTKRFTIEQQADILNANFQNACCRFSSLPTEKRKEKILNFLTRKGFSYREIKQKMEEEGF